MPAGADGVLVCVCVSTGVWAGVCVWVGRSYAECVFLAERRRALFADEHLPNADVGSRVEWG